MNEHHENWESFYEPGNRDKWQGLRHEGPGAQRIHEQVHCIDLREGELSTDGKQAFALVGFVSEEGIKRRHGRSGAWQGPSAFRHSMGKLYTPFDDNQIFLDVGNIVCRDGDLEGAQHALGEVVGFLLENDVHPLIIGGGHETSWGHYQGLVRAGYAGDASLVSFGAHLHLEPLLEGSRGTSQSGFLQIFQARHTAGLSYNCTTIGTQRMANSRNGFLKAQELGTRIILADEIDEGGWEWAYELLEEVLTRSSSVFLTVCLDVFASAFAPGVSDPQVLGLRPWQIIPLIKLLASSGKPVALEIAELSPPHDRDGITTALAIQLASIYIESFKKR